MVCWFIRCYFNLIKCLFIFSIFVNTHYSYAQSEKIIIDADVGVDDALAILLALASPELELVGITTVFGNATIENSTRNALYLVSMIGADVPVAKGAGVPLVLPAGPPADFVHGTNGLGNVNCPFDESLTPVDEDAAQFIISQSKRYPGELSLVPVGRLTNIALALKRDPTLPSRIKRIVLMGGAYQVPGNVTPVAEANIWGDPHAADIVFGAGWDIVAIGLDVTTKLLVNDIDLQGLARKNPEVGGFIRDFCQFYLAFYQSVGVMGGFYVHDPSAILYLLNPSLYTTQTAPVRVATQGIALGQTIAAFAPHNTQKGHWYQRPVSNIAIGVNATEAKTLLMQRLTKLKTGLKKH